MQEGIANDPSFGNKRMFARRLLAASRRPLLAATSAAVSAGGASACAACAAAPGDAGGAMPMGLPTGLPDVSALQVQMLGVSGLTGYTAGYAVKRTFKVFVFTTGCIFMGLQSLASNGLITVHWEQIEKRLQSLGDLNGDGVFDATDLNSGSEQMQAYLSAGLPSAGTFSAGFLMGLRS